mgnify:CR=1 FL=1
MCNCNSDRSENDERTKTKPTQFPKKPVQERQRAGAEVRRKEPTQLIVLRDSERVC